MAATPRERTALVAVRMWLESSEPTGFRVRITEIPDLGREVEHSVVFADVEDAIEHLASRIRAFAGGDAEA